MFVDPYLLERVYQRGTLKNTRDGFQFTLKNVVESGTLGGVKALRVDGAEIPLSSITLKSPDGERRAEEITYRSTVLLRYGGEMTVCVAGEPLAPGAHKLVLSISVLEAGGLQIPLQDEIQ